MTKLPAFVNPIKDSGLPGVVYMTCEETSAGKVQIYVGHIVAGVYCHSDLRGVFDQAGMFTLQEAHIRTLGPAILKPGDIVTIALETLNTLAQPEYEHLMLGGCYDPLTILVNDDVEGVDAGPSFQ